MERELIEFSFPRIPLKFMNCPKCNQELQQSGELDCDGIPMRVYQCESCIVEADFCGEKFAAALTFAVDAAGNFYDPVSMEPMNLN